MAAAVMMMLAVMFIMPDSAFAEDIPKADKFGQVKFYSTITPGKVIKDSYRYSDNWFMLEDTSTENKELALLSMQFVAAAVDNDADGLGGDFLRELGFTDIGYYGNPDLEEADCNYTYGIKTLSDGSKLVAVAIQSYAFDNNGKAKGWPQNFTVNDDTSEDAAEGEHFMLSQAAHAATEDIVDLAGSGEVRFWITGQSRGGALADIIAKNLFDRVSTRNIYAYTFEAPNVVQPADEADRMRIEDGYNFIHNYICGDDPVPMIPPWGMMRYGVVHELDTRESYYILKKNLEKLGSDAEIPENYNMEDARERAETVIEALKQRIQTRAEYSEDCTYTITLADGTTKTVHYNYQNLLGRLLATVFGGALDEADLNLDYLEEALEDLEIYIRGYLAECGMLKDNPDPDPYYWEAATRLNPFLKDKVNLDLKLTDDELYALLKLVAPALIDQDPINQDTGERIDYDPNSDADMPVTAYLVPALTLNEMIISHHFDTLIARLHTLAPAEKIDELDFDVDAVGMPVVSDPVTKMPRKLKAAVSRSSYSSWLDASAEWETYDLTLKNNKVYYLKATFRAAGHHIEDDVKVRINGEEPISCKVTYKDGYDHIEAVWKYKFGTPKMFEVIPENDYGENPEPFEVEAGTLLKYVEKPADPVYPGYRFGGWYSMEDIPWDEMTVNFKEYMNAKWIRVIDKITVNFTVPRVGQKWKYPTVPAKSPYRLEDEKVENDSYYEVTTINKKGKYALCFNVYINPKDAEFLIKHDFDNNPYYAGAVTINGKPATDGNVDGDHLSVSYEFKALDRLPELSKKSITVKKGKTAKVKILYKKKGSKNTYKKTKYAKVVSKRTASTIKVKGLKKGKTTLKIKVNGTWLKLKVRVK